MKTEFNCFREVTIRDSKAAKQRLGQAMLLGLGRIHSSHKRSKLEWDLLIEFSSPVSLEGFIDVAKPVYVGTVATPTVNGGMRPA